MAQAGTGSASTAGGAGQGGVGAKSSTACSAMRGADGKLIVSVP